MSKPDLAVILAAHNADPGRLSRVIEALASQSGTLPAWELVVVDNGSVPPLDLEWRRWADRIDIRLVKEPKLGLIWARRSGIAATDAPILVFADDDTLFDARYLETVCSEFAADERLGNVSGRIHPQFECTQPPWVNEFYDLLALRDFGDDRRNATGLDEGYPAFAFAGGGAAFRRSALQHAMAYMESRPGPAIVGRTGRSLDSGEDNDIILSLLRTSWKVAYSPALTVHHVIPAKRLTPEYLGRLNEGIQRSWVKVLARHDIRPWSAIPPWSVPLRKAKAFWTNRAWRGGAGYVRWRGACGLLSGQASLV